MQSQTKETATVMEPGDHMMMPARVAHTSAAGDEEESLEFIATDGAFDFGSVDTTEREPWAS